AASDDDAGPFLRQELDDLGLDHKQLVRYRDLIGGRKGVHSRVFIIDALFSVDHFVVGVKYIFGNIAVLRRHGDQFLIIKWDTQLLRDTETDLPAAAAKFPADGNDSAHMVFLPSV